MTIAHTHEGLALSEVVRGQLTQRLYIGYTRREARKLFDEEGSRMKETMKKAGYKYMRYLGKGVHILGDLKTGKLEAWCANKNHASYGIIYKNTHLEFMRSV